MASFTQPGCAKNLTEDEPFGSNESSSSIKIPQLPEKEYDFVEELSQDYICPVTLELLRDPQQTTCCGHHLSLEAATRLQQGGKPCPMCNEPNLTTMPDKFYKRKVNELKVRCPNKGSGCEWVGDLGSVDQHANSCPKRPWQCDFCDFKGTYEVVTNSHFPVCVKYPEPCPNQCEMVTVPRCDLEKHLTHCPLQLVECEFSQAGCHERIPRQDLSRHMEEGAQRHLLSMSLFNLNLTRELHKRMAEKDQQIATLQEQNRDLQRQLHVQQQGKQTERQLSLLQDTIQQQGRKSADNLKQQVAMLQQKIEQQGVGLQSKIDQQEKSQLRKTTALLDELDKKVVANGQKIMALRTKVEQQGEQLDKKVVANSQKFAALHTQVKQQGEQLDKEVVANGQKIVAHQTKVEQQGEQLDKKVVANSQKLAALHTQVKQQGEQLDKEVVANGQKIVALQTKVEQQGQQLDKSHQAVSKFKEEVSTHLSVTLPLFEFKMVITNYEMKKRAYTEECSEPFYCQGYRFKGNIDLVGNGNTRAYIFLLEGDNDDKLTWPIVIKGQVLLLNRLGDHNHHTANFKMVLDKRNRGHHRITDPFTKAGELEFKASWDTQYLKDDSLHFRWFLTVVPK